MKKRDRLQNHTVGNIGLYYVCYQLSRRGWNVMPTARNARGIDLVAYSHDGKVVKTIQVKTLSKKPAVPLGTSPERMMGDFFVICANAASDTPACFVLTPAEVARDAAKSGKENVSYWLEWRAYSKAEFREAWDRIGPSFGATCVSGEAAMMPMPQALPS